jgi:hypothetical protein
LFADMVGEAGSSEGVCVLLDSICLCLTETR